MSMIISMGNVEKKIAPAASDSVVSRPIVPKNRSGALAEPAWDRSLAGTLSLSEVPFLAADRKPRGERDQPFGGIIPPGSLTYWFGPAPLRILARCQHERPEQVEPGRAYFSSSSWQQRWAIEGLVSAVA